MVIMMANGNKGTCLENKKEKNDLKKYGKSSKSAAKESLSITLTSSYVKISRKMKEVKKASTSMFDKKDKLTLQEMQAKKYPFLDSGFSGMLHHLIIKSLNCLSPRVPKKWARLPITSIVYIIR